MNMQFLQRPIIQKITFTLSILFLLDLFYTFILNGRYSYMRSGFGDKPAIYQIDKWTGHIYLIVGIERIEVKK